MSGGLRNARAVQTASYTGKLCQAVSQPLSVGGSSIVLDPPTRMQAEKMVANGRHACDALRRVVRFKGIRFA